MFLVVHILMPLKVLILHIFDSHDSSTNRVLHISEIDKEFRSELRDSIIFFLDYNNVEWNDFEIPMI